ncbi:MAG: class I SAM-dependent RNA methyltransferase [Nocardioides sp.]
MARRPRPRKSRGRSRVGERFTALVGPVAHGGHCVVRLPEPETRVVFTRHALPGETVVVEITEGTEGDRFWRGDAVEVLAPAPDRVEAPCPVAGPGGCGGCDFQHATLPAQRALKTTVVREQLVRLGGLDATDPPVARLEVERVPAGPGDADDGLRWRTRVRFATTADGRRAMRKHHAHEVVPVDNCLIAHPDAVEPSPGERIVELVDTSRGSRVYVVARDGFWQVHPGAPRVLVETVLDLLEPQAGERCLDLYAGVGLFAGFLADAVGADLVVAVESDRAACRQARANLGPGIRVVPGSVDRVLVAEPGLAADLIVLDPPREGARRPVVDQVVAREPRAVAYVACDPAALARDVAIFAEHGYRLTRLRAFDLFPMTHHVECVALLTR